MASDEERRNAVREAAISMTAAIALCKANQLHVPMMILVYSAIDQMAFLSMPEDREDVNGPEFKRWCDTYLLPNSGLNCNSEDLWGARCGILHSHSPESRLSREGRAKRIHMGWGNASAADANARLRSKGHDNSNVFIHVDQLFEAIINGMARFFDGLQDDPQMEERVVRRGGKIFSNQPVLP